MIFKYFRKIDWVMMVFCVAFVIAQVYLELEIPKYMEDIIILLGTQEPSVGDIMDKGWLMIGCSLLSLGFAFITGFLSARISASLGRTLREKQFEKVQSFSMSEINKFSTPSLITRSTNDITQIQMVLAMGLVVAVRAPVMAILALNRIAGQDYRWTLATGITVGLVLAFILILMILIVPRFKKMQWLNDDLNRVTRENLTGIRVVRAYNAEKYQEEKFEKPNEELTHNYMVAFCALSSLMPVLTAVIGLLTVAIYYIGAVLIDSDLLNAPVYFGQMAVFTQYAVQIIIAIIMVIVILMILPRAMVASKRVQEVLNTNVSIVGGNETEGVAGHEGEIEFNDVSFTYPGGSEHVVSNISFKAKKGETIAFIGATGSGKSTIVNLIPRFYDVTEGEVLVDGRNVKEYTLESLHSKMGYVPQKAILFKGTIDSNVRFGLENNKRSKEDLDKSIEIAQASEFISKLVEKTDSPVAQNGTNLSGGQKQRVSIARAVCRKPEFYIFDDSFSALDYRTDSALREALRKETSGVTTLIVAQRIGTIIGADRIIVLENGKIAGMGKHDDLLENCSVYKDIALSQLSEEELIR